MGGRYEAEKAITLVSRLDDRQNSGRMSYTWIPMCSNTASKYQRYGYVHEKPFLPGERYSASRDMDRNVRLQGHTTWPKGSSSHDGEAGERQELNGQDNRHLLLQVTCWLQVHQGVWCRILLRPCPQNMLLLRCQKDLMKKS